MNRLPIPRRALALLLLVSLSTAARASADPVVALQETDLLEQHPGLVIAAAAIIVSESALIAMLVKQRLRRRAAAAPPRGGEPDAARALEQREARNTAILQAMPDLMFVIGADGTYLDFHARDRSQLFVPPEVFLGRTVREIMPPALAERFMAAFAEAARTGESVIVDYDLPIGDNLRHYEARIVRDAHGRIVSVVRDMTDRVSADRALADSEAALRRTSDRNQDLAGRLIASQEAERQRIARDLHDDLGQRLALLNVELEQLQMSGPGLAGEARTRVLRIAANASEITADIHRLSHDLHPERLKVLGLVPGIAGLCRDIGTQYALTVVFEHENVPEITDPTVAVYLYRIVQEALRNIVRHSGAKEALVKLSRDGDQLYLQIADPGVGFCPQAIQSTSGLGLVSIRERANYIGGRLVIHTAPGAGTRIGVLVPLAPQFDATAMPIPRA